MTGDQEQSSISYPPGTGKTGALKISHLFLLLCLGVAGFLGAQAVSGYVTYLSMREGVRTVIRNVASVPHKADEANAKLVAKAQELGIPVREDEVFLKVYEARVQVRMVWQHTMGLGRFTFPLTFEVDESQALR
ncbi:MAG: hypothetical protein ACE5G5_02040 [Candidatus Methylomirabilales bacterium]